MKFGRRCGAGLAVCGVVLATLTGCPETSPAPKGGQHRANRPPVPGVDPAPRNPSFPGGVRLTFWLEQRSGEKTVTTYNAGAGPVTHNCDRSCHWDVNGVQPNQTVTFVTVYFTPGTKGHLAMQVVQGNNGRIVCQDNNDDADGHGGIDGQGVVTI